MILTSECAILVFSFWLGTLAQNLDQLQLKNEDAQEPRNIITQNQSKQSLVKMWN
jgi:hypothetical protein